MLNKDNEQMIENITKQTFEMQNQLLRNFARVDLKTRLKILKNQKHLFHFVKTTKEDVSNDILTYISFISAIKNVIKEIDLVSMNAIKLHNKFRKVKIKRQKLLDYWAVVKTLKEDKNMSFRKISNYFNKYHKFKISHSLIQKIWNENEQKGEKNGNK